MKKGDIVRVVDYDSRFYDMCGEVIKCYDNNAHIKFRKAVEMGSGETWYEIIYVTMPHSKLEVQQTEPAPDIYEARMNLISTLCENYKQLEDSENYAKKYVTMIREIVGK